ncbi:OmpA family protein [Thaumasiovibrio subtropicus]|uniref:OmpA family protein n=1 Tax=Thaumasiovibrio subtropicus TaxID=1891207 RepID=UPI000B34FB5E|nr:OmpA family protein [Thaumasiovibrio subtropicus]
MKGIALLLSVFLLAGCSSNQEIAPYSFSKQQSDLRDFDNDGVINERDKCEETPSEAIVDNDGCPSMVQVQESYKLQVLFGNGQTEIPSQYVSEIKQMANFLLSYSDTSLEIQGYASPTGSPELNLELSKKRAEAVRLQLMRFGVKPSRLTIVGYGDANPINLEDSEAAHALSRRVVGTVVGFRGDIEKEWTIFSRREI